MTEPEEIAGLIERAKKRVNNLVQFSMCKHEEYLEWQLAAALQQQARWNELRAQDIITLGQKVGELEAERDKQAREIERLKLRAECGFCDKPFGKFGGICESCHGARIDELEAALQREIADKLVANLKVIELEAERDAAEDRATKLAVLLDKAEQTAIALSQPPEAGEGGE